MCIFQQFVTFNDLLLLWLLSLFPFLHGFLTNIYLTFKSNLLFYSTCFGVYMMCDQFNRNVERFFLVFHKYFYLVHFLECTTPILITCLFQDDLHIEILLRAFCPIHFKSHAKQKKKYYAFGFDRYWWIIFRFMVYCRFGEHA